MFPYSIHLLVWFLILALPSRYFLGCRYLTSDTGGKAFTEIFKINISVFKRVYSIPPHPYSVLDFKVKRSMMDCNGASWNIVFGHSWTLFVSTGKSVNPREMLWCLWSPLWAAFNLGKMEEETLWPTLDLFMDSFLPLGLQFICICEKREWQVSNKAYYVAG